jgi:hypothetical protein
MTIAVGSAFKVTGLSAVPVAVRIWVTVPEAMLTA